MRTHAWSCEVVPLSTLVVYLVPTVCCYRILGILLYTLPRTVAQPGQSAQPKKKKKKKRGGGTSILLLFLAYIYIYDIEIVGDVAESCKSPQCRRIYSQSPNP